MTVKVALLNIHDEYEANKAVSFSKFKFRTQTDRNVNTKEAWERLLEWDKQPFEEKNDIEA